MSKFYRRRRRILRLQRFRSQKKAGKVTTSGYPMTDYVRDNR